MVEVRSRNASLLAATVCGLALTLALVRVGLQLAPAAWLDAALRSSGNGTAGIVFHFATLPRLVVAILCGAGLAVSGAIVQHVLGNPLASPVTLGVSSGAQLALVGATLFGPAALGAMPDAVALAGGVASMGVVFAVASAQRFSSLAVILSGLSVGLFCGALGALLKLYNQDYLDAVFLWNAGSLAQEDWSVVGRLLPRLAILAAAAALLLRPLRLLGLSEDGAQGLGLSLALYRTLTLGVAVGLAATVTAAVGMIGFVEIAAPLASGLAGARTLGHRLVVSAALGAALLVIVDTLVGIIDDRAGLFLPTGAATAFLAAPLLLWLLPRMRADAGAASAHLLAPQARRADPRARLAALAAVTVAAGLLAVGVGRTGAGWSIPNLDTWPLLLPWRIWRVLDAFVGGAMAATAGALLQRSTGNAMASPEILGVGAAVMAGFALALTVSPQPSVGLLLASGTGTALALTGFILWRGSRARFAPDQLLLTGLALSAALDALVIAFQTANDGRAAILLAFMSGSTAGADPMSVLVGLGGAAVAIPTALLFRRGLDVMPLGDPLAQALGVALGPTRLGTMLLASVLTAGAVLAMGPLTFVGLVGPHVAARLGFRRAGTHLVGAALTGGLLMLVADWLGRVAIAPFELPSGLMAALIGIPYLVWRLCRPAAS